MGLPAALCFYVAKDLRRARDYVATSRAMMLGTGASPSRPDSCSPPPIPRKPRDRRGYRIAFGISTLTYVGITYSYALQPRHLRAGTVRTIQPVLTLLILIILWFLKVLTLNTTLFTIAITLTLQLGWGYWHCRKTRSRPDMRAFR